MLATAGCEREAGSFQFWCGGFLVDLPRMQTPPGPGEQAPVSSDKAVENPYRYQFWEKRYGQEQDTDNARPGCIPDDRLDELERMAGHAELASRAMTSPAGEPFADPTPNQLGPVVEDEDGQAAVRFYADPTLLSAGATRAVGPGGAHRPDYIAFVRFGMHGVGPDAPDWNAYKSVAHELHHVFQDAQPWMQAIPGTTVHPPAEWIPHATADAIAVRQLQDWDAPGDVGLSVRGSRSLHGLRPWDRALTWDSKNLEDGYGHKVITLYTNSSLFAYLADRFHGTEFNYLIDWYKHNQIGPAGSVDWLQWLDHRVTESTGYPLYMVFPDFIANYAGWGKHKYPHLGEEDWLDESFEYAKPNAGCIPLTLAPAMRRRVVHPVTMEPVSARCFQVSAQGIDEQRYWVESTVFSGNRQVLDDSHLVSSRMGFPANNEFFDCYEESETYKASDTEPPSLCIREAFQTAQGDTLTPWSDRGGVTATSPGLKKTWRDIEQRGLGSSVRNTYFLVHAPVKPTDAEHSVFPPHANGVVSIDSVEFFLRTPPHANVIYSGALQGEYEVPEDRATVGILANFTPTPGIFEGEGCAVSASFPSEEGDLVTIGGMLPAGPTPGRYSVRPHGSALVQGEMAARVFPLCERGLCDSPDPDEFNNDVIGFAGTLDITHIDRYSASGSFELSSVEGPAVGVTGTFTSQVGGDRGFPAGHACTPVTSPPPTTDGTLAIGPGSGGVDSGPSGESPGTEGPEEDTPSGSDPDVRLGELPGPDLILEFPERTTSVLQSTPQGVQGSVSGTSITLVSDSYDLALALPTFGCSVAPSESEAYRRVILDTGEVVGDRTSLLLPGGALRVDATSDGFSFEVESPRGSVSMRASGPDDVQVRYTGPAGVRGDVTDVTVDVTLGLDSFTCLEPLELSFSVSDGGGR
jgi:hypothetical protein